MRCRNIKPGIFKNEILGELDPMATLLFIGLIQLADRDGKLEDRPKRIKAELFPYRENVDIETLLSTLLHYRFIERYEVDGMRIILLPSFKEHQHPHHTEKKSIYPDKPIDYDNNGELTVNSRLNNGEYPSSSLNPSSLNPSSLNPESVHLHSHAIVPNKKNAPDPDPNFEIIWINWKPFEMNKGDKAKALKAYATARKTQNHDHISQSAQQYIRWCHATRTKSKHVVTWLNERNRNNWAEPDLHSQQPHIQPTNADLAWKARYDETTRMLDNWEENGIF